MMLAPIVMAYLGRQKQQQGVGADGLGRPHQRSFGRRPGTAGIGRRRSGGLATSMLDSDHDGSAVDEHSIDGV